MRGKLMPLWGWISIVFAALQVIAWLLGKQRAKGCTSEAEYYYCLQEAELSYLFNVQHSKVPPICKLIYFIFPFELKWTDNDIFKWGTVSLSARNEFNRDIYTYEINNFEIRRKGNKVKIRWPRGVLIDKEVKIISVNVTEHVLQSEIRGMVALNEDQVPSVASKRRWHFKIKNVTDAIIRDYEISLTDKVDDPNNIDIIEIRPGNSTSEIDIVVESQCSLDIFKRAKSLPNNAITWYLPKIEKQSEMSLIIDC